MSIPLNQFSLKNAFKNAVNLKYGAGSTIANTINDNFWVNIILYVYDYAPLISGIGAVCHAMSNIISADILSIVVNKNIILFFNLLIGYCGATVVAEWLFLDALLDWMIPFAKILSGAK